MTVRMVKRVISMWPREVWDITEEGSRTLYLKKHLPELREPGVYVLYLDEIPYYIGQAGVLYKRLHDHSNKSTDTYFNFWNFFSAFISEHDYLDAIEGVLIAAMPTANSSKPKMDRVKLPDFVGDEDTGDKKARSRPTNEEGFAKVPSTRRRDQRRAARPVFAQGVLPGISAPTRNLSQTV
jgi:hypothetical protein